MKDLKYTIKNFLIIAYLLFILITTTFALIIGGAVIISNIFNIALWIAAIIYIILLLNAIPILIFLTRI